MFLTLILQQAATNVPPITIEIILVCVITVGVFISFTSEMVPADVTALITIFTLMVLEPWTQISPTEGVSGFSNEATLTVLAMFILSAGMSQTGAIQKLDSKTYHIERSIDIVPSFVVEEVPVPYATD